MFQTINGVQIREHTETTAVSKILEKRFEIEYLDHIYLEKLVCIDLINIPVNVPIRKYGFKRIKHCGRMWIYVVKHNDFEYNRSKYGEVCSLIHEKIREFELSHTDIYLIDSMERVYETQIL